MVGDLQAPKSAHLKPRRGEEPQQPKAGLYSDCGTALSHLLRGEERQKGEARAASMEKGLDINNTFFFIK